ncbi:hypothetical protein JG688_00002900 [Phytophthora aleatoria]|uniref:RxLR effector protein n=1 Tax=Phytophthora aleatoria TaxID=2496075 RepID=A0A8J5J039_9STRA|nr:hypothetical protein JG688_00002900 [Phytophthora aleatoria]
MLLVTATLVKGALLRLSTSVIIADDQLNPSVVSVIDNFFGSATDSQHCESVRQAGQEEQEEQEDPKDKFSLGPVQSTVGHARSQDRDKVSAPGSKVDGARSSLLVPWL